MATLTLIAEPFPDWEAAVHSAACRDLAEAVAQSAPRSCSVRYLVARGTEAPAFQSPVLDVESLPLRAGMLPIVWQSGATARPLDGEFVHATTPMIPLRSRGEDDGSQTSVMIPNSIAWDHPTLLPGNQARLFRSFAKRAVRLADVILAPTHATARVVQEHYGRDLPIQVMQLAPPREFRRQEDSADRRAALGLPERYVLTTATATELGRLDWVFDAMRSDPGLPPLVVLEGFDPVPADSASGAKSRGQAGAAAQAPGSEGAPAPHGTHSAADPAGAAAGSDAGDVPAELRGRVVVVRPRELADFGAIISGAGLLLTPQSYAGTGYLVLGALKASVPVLHSGHPSTAELVLDGGIAAETPEAFGAELRRLFTEPGALARLSVLARDRSRGFSWEAAAWQLWETHANL
ncbi:mannosyltransferase [Leucobacter sp. CSA2]|uniref:Mannosyltransferase n=1 Tax=Leucobacter edaphi TaxID=2796472 RepID=A0A934QBI7_9MICO|nr:mannosyltransferase [Leucobacter edaphi]MBK0421650.1 mannosyltransferase [Leucobacter edaphi]